MKNSALFPLKTKFILLLITNLGCIERFEIFLKVEKRLKSPKHHTRMSMVKAKELGYFSNTLNSSKMEYVKGKCY